MLVLGLINIPIWLIVLTVIIFAIYLYGTRNFSYWKKRGIKSPPVHPYFGETFRVIKHGYSKIIEENVRKLGKNHGTYFFSSPTFFTADIDMIKKVCIKHADCFTDRLGLSQKGPLHKGITNLKGAEWKRVRNILSPTFTSGKLKGMYPLIEEATQSLCKQFSKAAELAEIPLKDYCSNFTLDVIASTMFGLNINCQDNPDNLFKLNGKKIFNPSFMTYVKSFFLLAVPSIAAWIYEKLDITVTDRSSLQFFTDVITDALQKRKECQDKDLYKDFVAIVSASEENSKIEDADESDKIKNKSLSRDEVLAQSLIFFLAGFETTSNTMQYVFYLLALYPECAEKCYQEIKNAGTLDYETVMNLKYLNQCIDEALRMYPPAVVTNRVCTQDISINGYDFEKGVSVMVPIYYLGHDPDVWDKPDTFNPDRFDEDSVAARDFISYIPFGVGPRNCIGMRLAQLELRKGLAESLLRFKFEPSENTVAQDKLDCRIGTTVPKTSILLKVVPRENNN